MIKGQRVKLVSQPGSLQRPRSYHLHITHRPSCSLQQLTRTRTFLFTTSAIVDLCDVRTYDVYVPVFSFF